MNASSTPRYPPALMILHWLTLLLLIGVYACIEGREFFPRGSVPREALKSWHFMLGLTVFGVTWVRLAARLIGTIPPITPTPPAWQSRLAQVVHVALYAIMLGMPVGGWIILSAAGKPIPWFGFELPALVAPDKALAKQVKEIHEIVGQVGLFLIGLHTVAALFHHYLVHDDTLRRLLPGRQRPE